MLNVCETFVSIQGESTFAGFPCFFIRLAGCNLRCRFCDTPQAFTKSYQSDTTELVNQFRLSKIALAEVTGGEPLLQPETIILLEELKKYGKVLLETNGSIDIANVPEEIIIIIDVKCPGSNEQDSFYIKNLEKIKPNTQIKFVITDQADYRWAKEFIFNYRLIDKPNIILFSPCYPVLPPEDLAKWILNDKLPVKLNLQLHKLLGTGFQ
jgi:7-carboxy-7-deazaguanine synthase